MRSQDATRVSVVIASYNHARFIGEAIQSVLDQDYQQFEIVITDDCSSDNSAEVIRKFSDPRIKLNVLDKNAGPSIAMNDAILRSSGEFVAHLGSDDFFLPGKLRRQVEYLDQNSHVSATFGLPRLVDEDGAALNIGLQEFTLPFADVIPTRYDWLRHFFYVGNCLCHPTVLIRRSVHDRLGLYNEKLRGLADFDMWIRTCLDGEIHISKEELIGRRVLKNSQNLSAQRRDSILQCNFEESQILKHYKNLSERDFSLIFSKDLKGEDLTTADARNYILAKYALGTGREFTKYFALSTIFEIEKLDSQKCREFIELSSTVDAFGIFNRYETEIELRRLLEQHSELRRELDSARNETVRQAEMLSLAQSRLASAIQERLEASKKLSALYRSAWLRYPYSKERRNGFLRDRLISLFPSLDI